jgi:hypothetical protein
MKNQIREMQKQAIKKARPTATVFFRFSHRNECKETLSINEQKEKVKEVIKTILAHRNAFQESIISDVIKFGPMS